MRGTEDLRFKYYIKYYGFNIAKTFKMAAHTLFRLCNIRSVSK